MLRISAPLIAVATFALAGCSVGRALHVATAFSAHELCAQAFVMRQPVAPFMQSYVRPMVGVPVVRGALRYAIDPATQTVRTSVAGAFRSRAQYADGRGCTVLNGGVAPAPIQRQLDAANGHDPLPTRPDPALVPALDQAFTPDRRAIVVVRDGQIVAERYAPGYSESTRLQSWSMAKSMTNALIGILVRQGRLSLDGPIPGLPAGVTIDRLLRQTSGQPFGSSNSGFDRASRMQFLEPDTAGYAMTSFVGRPGSRWSYTDANYAVLSGILRRTLGGTPESVARFADDELFGPTGMRSALIEFDGAGNPMGANWAYASARDWARFGLLYAHDGVVGGRRILPQGWVAYSAKPTDISDAGYGAGFWTNLGNSPGAERRKAWGLPADSFFALGNSGQVVLIAPSSKLVIVSMGFDLDPSNRRPVAAVARLFIAANAGRASSPSEPSG